VPVCPESTPLCAPFGWFTVHLEVCVMQFYSECVCTVLSLVHFPVSYNFSPKQVHMSMKFTTQFWCTTLKVSLFTVRRFHSVMKCELLLCCAFSYLLMHFGCAPSVSSYLFLLGALQVWREGWFWFTGYWLHGLF
jgi:hypothetical protein